MRSVIVTHAIGLVLGSAPVLSAADVAEAQPHAVELTLEEGAPDWLPGCLSRASLEASLRAARGAAAPSEPAPTQLSVHIRSVAEPTGRQATLEIRARDAHRELGPRVLGVHVDDCDAMGDAVALVLVLLSRAAGANADPPLLAAASAQARDPELPPVFDAEPERARGRTLELQVAAGGGVVWGVLPRAAVGPRLAVSLGASSWSARIRAGMSWPQASRIAEGSVELFDASVTAEGCLRAALRQTEALELGACAGPRLGFVSVNSRGFALQNVDSVDPTLHLGATLESALRLTGSTWLRVHLGVEAALVRTRYVVQVPRTGEASEVPSPALLRTEVGGCLAQIF